MLKLLPLAPLLLVSGCVVAFGNWDHDHSHFRHDGVEYDLYGSSLHLVVNDGNVEARAGGRLLRVEDGRLSFDGVDCGMLQSGDEVYVDEDGTLYVNGKVRYGD
ncbi:MAG: hypothetical protein EYC70_12800 [Planctomycetota bacterium]|nr:MAG: hypothetical protein EYC70_12800 [Planctomycetota bacterium]